jgi:hypothetical protein
MSLMRDVPTVAGRGQQLLREATTQIAAHLHNAYPDELDALSAAAMVGAFIGAIDAALQVTFDDPGWNKIGKEVRRKRIIAATRTALQPWALADI